MKNTMKKIASAALALTMTLALAACGAKEAPAASQPSSSGAASSAPASSAPAKMYKIGISQFGEHPSLDNCRMGFLQGLEEAGLKEGVDYEINYMNASFDTNICTQIGTTFSAENVDLMVGIATPSATACYAAAEDKNMPVIFTAITDPVEAKLDSGNVTGTSDKLPVEAQLDLIRTLQPEAKTIGIIYTTSEPNSVSAIAEYQEKAPEYGFTIEVVGITSQAEVTQAVDTLLNKGIDCMSNLTDNTVVGVLSSTLEKTDAAGVPVYGSEVEQVKIGCVAAAGIDYIALGIQTGQMAAKVLRGEATCEEIPYETISEYGIYINSDALNAMGIEIPASVADKAIEANG